MSAVTDRVLHFLKEAKRRKVYVSAVGYAAVSLGLIELVQAVSDALLFPAWTSRLVTFLLLLGFPVVVVLAWIFDITGEGVQRTKPLEEEKTARQASRPPPTTTAPRQRRDSLAGALARRPPIPAAPGSRRRGAPKAPPAGEDAAPAAAGGGEPAPDPDRVRRAALGHARHELRTPINAIIGYSEMLLEEAGDDSVADLRRIREAGGKLLSLVEEILAPERIAAGGGERDLESFGEQIRVNLRNPVNAVVGYAELLIENAEEEGHRESVPDLERILSAARRLLELSTDIVRLATEGAASADAALGREADLARGVLAKIQPVERGAPAGEAEGRLLVVDDNALNRDLVSRQLAKHGFIVTTAADGAQALELLARREFDLVLLDVIMPGMDGIETLSRIKADPKLEDLPVLMLSSLDEVDSAVRCIELGAEEYLPKPIQPSLLEARIGANLEVKRLRAIERALRERLEADEILIERLMRGAFPPFVAERVRSGDGRSVDSFVESAILACHFDPRTRPAPGPGLGSVLDCLRGSGKELEALAGHDGGQLCLWTPRGLLVAATGGEEREGAAARLARLALRARDAGLGEVERGGYRFGLHVGPVVGAVVGGEGLRYQLWGEGVETAEALADRAGAAKVLVSPTARGLLRAGFTFESGGVTEVPGSGQMRVWHLEGAGPVAPEAQQTVAP